MGPWRIEDPCSSFFLLYQQQNYDNGPVLDFWLVQFWEEIGLYLITIKPKVFPRFPSSLKYSFAFDLDSQFKAEYSFFPHSVSHMVRLQQVFLLVIACLNCVVLSGAFLFHLLEIWNYEKQFSLKCRRLKPRHLRLY